MHIIVGSVNGMVKCCVLPGVVFRVEFLWNEAELQWAGRKREGGERRAGRTETTPATATCWHLPPGTYMHTHTHTLIMRLLVSHETAITHVLDVIQIWCVSSLSLTRPNLILEVSSV